jgi:2-polyprenyl-3-methyl-5-hydroxy-6-metoxy-1,4-benzoquinol methylase
MPTLNYSSNKLTLAEAKSTMFTRTPQCRICGNTHLVLLLDLGQQYLTGVFPSTPDAPLTRGPLQLVRCAGPVSCGLVQLAHTYRAGEMYGENYGYRSSLNRTMVDHLRDINNRVRRRVSLGSDDVILDIGSNDGTLLSFYPENGPLLIGMDPTAARFRTYYRSDVRLVVDFFSAEAFFKATGGRKARIVTSIAMFYDLPDPLSFMRQVAQVLDDEGIWHFEQSYLPAMLQADAYDTVCHEHLEYYTLRQIAWMADRSDLKILDVARNDINGGSFAVTAARKGSAHVASAQAVQQMLDEESAAGYDTQAPYEAFARRVAEHRDGLRKLLHELKNKGKSVLGYGASTKGNVILQYCGIGTADLPAIAEVNRDKFGHFTPGTNIPIISEADAHAQKPDYFLVLPWHFRQNLLEREASFVQRGGRMIFPLPKIDIWPT